MVVHDRRERILEVVRCKGFAALSELANTLQVSESTIRRDLDQLEKAGTTKRTHGGAFYTGPSPGLPHFEVGPSGDNEKKRAIATLAARQIEPGDTILLDGGTTTYELARLLVGRPLQVVTNSLPVANLFVAEPSTDLILAGGYVHARTGVVHGHYTNEMLKTLNVRRAVLSAAGVTEKGVFNNSLLLGETEQAMMQAADEVILLADSTKFGRRSLAHVGDLRDFDKIVVDAAISDDWKNKIAKAGVEMILAGTSDVTK